jgi:TPR repeat protein
MQTSIQFAPASQNYTNELNNAAWTIYRYTHDPYYTAQALSWSKRALEFFESPAAMDTHAKLLYRTGNKKEAIEWLEKAATLIREKKAPPFPANIEQTLQKMKQDTVPIDEY